MRLEDPRVEVVVVDDASDDDTFSRLSERYGDAVTLLRHETNRGAGAARNTGARTARGTWCFILDSDNRLLPGATERVLSHAERSSAGLVFLGSVSESGLPTGRKSLPDGPVDWRELLVLRRLRGEYCAMPRRDALLRHPYYEKPGRDNVHVTWIRIARESGLDVHDEPILRYDDTSDDRLSNRRHSLADPGDAAWCHHDLIEQFGPELRELDPLAWGDHLAKAAFFEVLDHRRLAGARTLLRSLAVSPTRSTVIGAAALLLGPGPARHLYGG